MFILFIDVQYCTLLCNIVQYHKEMYKVHRCTVMYALFYQFTSLFNKARTNILSFHANLLSKYWMNIGHILSKYFPNIVQILPKYCPNIAYILTTYFKHVVDHLCFLQHKSLTLTPKIAKRGNRCSGGAHNERGKHTKGSRACIS